jgi:hypothetical protein
MHKGMIKAVVRKEEKETPSLWSWVIITAFALLFVLYGFFMFFMIGDKGAPDWDFNVVEDTPGKSQTSTYPEPLGNGMEPERQHVAGRPPLAPADEGEVSK